MISIVVAILVAVGVSYCGWWLDVWLTQSRFSVRSVLSLVLLGALAWLITLILTEPCFLDSAVHEGTLFWFRMRVVAVFVMLGCLAAAVSVVAVTIAGLLMAYPLAKWRLCVVPAIALVFFALAWYLVGTHQFFPTA